MNFQKIQNLKQHLLSWSINSASKGFFVTATDTNVGKTHACAFLAKALNAYYFKPIQAGDLDIGGDTAKVKLLTGLDDAYFINPIYNLEHALSPHEAAQKQNILIDMNNITLPKLDKKRHIIVEGAGGVMVPINDNNFIIDLIKKFNLPAIVVVRSELGTLNHSILTINALRSYNIPIAAIIMSGQLMMNNLISLKKYTHIQDIFVYEWL